MKLNKITGIARRCRIWAACRLFGHTIVDEVYVTAMWGTNLNPKHKWFSVVTQCRCYRCGRIISTEMSDPKRRSQLLQEGWFLERGGMDYE